MGRTCIEGAGCWGQYFNNRDDGENYTVRSFGEDNKVEKFSISWEISNAYIILV